MTDLRRVGAARLGGPVERPPLVSLIVAGSFCVYFGLLVYCDIFRPVNPGFEADPSPSGAVVITKVKPGTPAERAGMAVGDHLIAINNVVIIDSDAWGALGANYQIDVAMPVLVARNGERLQLEMVLPPGPPGYWLTRTGATLLLVLLAQLVTLLSGLFIVWRRPRDSSALAAALFLLACVVFVIALRRECAIVWRGLPALIRELLWIPYASSLHDRPHPALVRHVVPPSPSACRLRADGHIGQWQVRPQPYLCITPHIWSTAPQSCERSAPEAFPC